MGTVKINKKSESEAKRQRGNITIASLLLILVTAGFQSYSLLLIQNNMKNTKLMMEKRKFHQAASFAQTLFSNDQFCIDTFADTKIIYDSSGITTPDHIINLQMPQGFNVTYDPKTPKNAAPGLVNQIEFDGTVADVRMVGSPKHIVITLLAKYRSRDFSQLKPYRIPLYVTLGGDLVSMDTCASTTEVVPGVTVEDQTCRTRYGASSYFDLKTGLCVDTGTSVASTGG